MTVTKPTLALTPHAHAALTDEAMTAIGYRAVELHCRMSAMQTRKGWTVRCQSWAEDARHDPLHRVAHHHVKGSLEVALNAILDEYSHRFAYTPEELLTIANASGIAVSRA